MTRERFMRERGADWDELRGLLEAAGARPERLGPDRVRRLGGLYRATTADLAVARRRFAGDPLVDRLEALAARARVAVYTDAEPRRAGLWAFVSTGYWQRVAERPVPLLVAAALLFVPAVLGYAWALGDPAAAIGLVPEEYRGPTQASGDVGLGAGERAGFSAQIFTNNIQVTLLAFAGGITGGLLTAAVTIYNGLLIGGLAGLVAGAGQGSVFLELVAPHGVLELSCIVVVAAAGLRLGWAMIAPPDHVPRLRALGAEARRAVEIALGTAPWLVLAGLVEGFVTGSGLGLGGALAVGVPLGVVYWALVVWRGSGRRRSPSGLA